MSKKLVAMLLAVMLLISSFAFAEELVANVNLDSKWPVVNEPISVKIAVVPQGGSVEEDPNNFWIVDYWKQNTNLDIEWQMLSPATSEERIQLMLSTGDLPDAILGYGFSYSQVTQYAIGDGLFYPIDELLDYCPNFSALLEERPDYKAALSTSEGKFYGFPQLMDGGYSCPTRFFINVDWLAALDMELPTTLDEFYDVLCAFRDNDMNGNGDATDEIPFGGSWSEGYSERSWILPAFGLAVRGNENLGLDYSGEEPSVVFAPRTEAYKDYLTYMNKLWNEGLLDPDMFTQTDTQSSARILEDRVGIAGMPAPFVSYPSNPEAYEASYPLAAEGYDQIYVKANAIGTPALAVINSECDLETAAALANFFDSMYDRDEYILSRWGLEKGSEGIDANVGYWYDAENDKLVYDLPEGMSSEWEWKINDLTFWAFPGYVGDGNDAWEISYAKDNPDTALGQYLKDGVRRESWVPPVIERDYAYAVDGLPAFYMSTEDLERVNELSTPLDDYVTNMEAKFITGSEPIENIDEFWAMLDQMNVEEYVSIYAGYYAQYLANM